MNNSVVVIANPTAGGGRGAKILARVRSTLPSRKVTVLETTKPGDETKLALRAIEEGARALVAVGGDGTWSKVAAAILQSERRLPLALIAAGTGNDLAKSVGAPAHDIERTFALLDAGEIRRVDVGKIEDRFFLVCCGFGFDTAVLHRMQSVRGFQGSARYLYAALRELSAYKGFVVTVADEERSGSAGHEMRELLMLVFANTKHYGGAFKIAPQASLTDGELDAIAIKQLPPFKRLALLAAATRGRHIGSPAVFATHRSSFDLRFPLPPEYNVDGDLFQARSRNLRVECVPGALDVVGRAAIAWPDAG